MGKIKLSTALIVIAFFSCIICSSRKSTNEHAQLTGKVAEQLQLSKENLAARKIDASIIAYEMGHELKDNNEVAALKPKLIDDDNLVPEFDGLNIASFKLSTIKDRMSRYRKKSNDDEQNVVQNLELFILPNIKIGHKVLTLSWKADGKQFNSTCVYDDEEGIVYDNILSNIAFTEATELPTDERINSSTQTNKREVNAQYHFTSTVKDITIKWAWGSTRGKIVIKHYIIYNGYNYIYDYGGTTDAWMSGGSAAAKWARNYLNRSSRSKLAWAYGWATPTASFSIKFNTKTITFSASTGGIGSKGSGSGVHTIYLP